MFLLQFWLFNYSFTFIELNGQKSDVLNNKCLESSYCNNTLLKIVNGRNSTIKHNFDRIGSNQYPYRNKKSINLPENENKEYLYINYKEAYGIRFEPNSIPKRLLQITNNESDDSGPSTNDIGSSPVMGTADTENGNDSSDLIPPNVPMEGMSEVNTIQPTEEAITIMPAASSTETQLPSSTQMPEQSSTADYNMSISMPTKRPGGSFPFLGKISPTRKNNTIIMQPTPTLRETLSFIRNRLKQLFTSGIHLDTTTNGQRFLSVFNLINLESGPCTSTQPMLTEMAGVCYSDYDCTQKGGTAIDTCADGVGVCCICK